MTLDNWAREVTTLTSIVTQTGPHFTEAEKRHWLRLLADASVKDEEEARA